MPFLCLASPWRPGSCAGRGSAAVDWHSLFCLGGARDQAQGLVQVRKALCRWAWSLDSCLLGLTSPWRPGKLWTCSPPASASSVASYRSSSYTHSSLNIFFFFKKWICVEYFAFMFACTSHVCNAHRGREEGIRSLQNEVRGGCELFCRYWELNLDSLNQCSKPLSHDPSFLTLIL